MLNDIPVDINVIWPKIITQLFHGLQKGCKPSTEQESNIFHVSLPQIRWYSPKPFQFRVEDV